MNTNGNLLKRMFSSDVIDPPKGEEFLGSRDVSSAQLFALICVHWRFSSLPLRKFRSEFARTTTSLRFQKQPLTRSTEFKPETGSTLWSRPGFQVLLRVVANFRVHEPDR